MSARATMPADPDLVVLVDEADRPIGAVGKLPAHREGLLHRAVSVLLFDAAGRMLLQRRALTKYHSGGLWANACCTHPYVDEPAANAAARRLGQELNVDCPLTPAFEFTYRAEVSNGLVEHEYIHAFTGRLEALPDPDPAEVAECRWFEPGELAGQVAASPAAFAPWFRLYLQQPALQAWLAGGPVPGGDGAAAA